MTNTAPAYLPPLFGDPTFSIYSSSLGVLDWLERGVKLVWEVNPAWGGPITTALSYWDPLIMNYTIHLSWLTSNITIKNHLKKNVNRMDSQFTYLRTAENCIGVPEERSLQYNLAEKNGTSSWRPKVNWSAFYWAAGWMSATLPASPDSQAMEQRAVYIFRPYWPSGALSPRGQRCSSGCRHGEPWSGRPPWPALCASSSILWWPPSPSPPAHEGVSVVCRQAWSRSDPVCVQTEATSFLGAQLWHRWRC